MNELSVVLAVFICTPDALICRDVSEARGFANPPECHAAAAARRDSLRNELGDGPLIFTRCRYRLLQTPARPSPVPSPPGS